MNIIVGVSGGIAAYKSVALVRQFIKRGDSVRVIMTQSAKDFITPLTLATVSQNPVMVDNFDPTNGAWNSHVSLGLWADLIVIAPATANTIAKMACGIADNLLLCTVLSARCDVWIAPAMDLDMYRHEATQFNLTTLRSRGVKMVEPGSGFLASGLEGKGRMAEPEEIADAIYCWAMPQDFSGKRVLITAGGTIERIDPVRFISNFSTGKMGIALAETFVKRGAEVVLVKTSSAVWPKCDGVKVIEVESANDMYEAVRDNFESCDIAVFAAAVADYSVDAATKKIKHDNKNVVLELKPTKDIAYEMGKIKGGRICVGFALETNDAQQNAVKKLTKKNLDAIILNSLEDSGAGFGVDTNKITIISANDNQSFDLKSKSDVAVDIVNYIKGLC